MHGGDLEDAERQAPARDRRAAATGADAPRRRATRCEALERLDQLPWVGGIPTVTAQVTALSPSDFAATVQLDKGSTSGVAVGMPVVGGAGLVGQVIEVWSSGCTVRLVTDVDSSVGVRFGRPGTSALVQGSGLGKHSGGQPHRPRAPPLHKGEVLTTSGLQDAQYPADIPVARVTSFSSTPSATQETVSARPLADLAVLQYVDVLQWQSAP